MKKKNLINYLLPVVISSMMGDDEGGGNKEVDQNSEAFKKAVSDAVNLSIESETEGLKTKNSELIEKLKESKLTSASFEGMDVQKVKTIMQLFEQNEEAQLIADGKFDEVMKKRTDSIQEGFHDQLASLTERTEKAEKSSTLYKSRLDEGSIRNALTSAALKSGVRKDAIDDIVRRGVDVFSVNEKGEVEARDQNGDLLQNSENLLLNPERFINALKEVTPYYWADSNSGGTGGSSSGTQSNKSGSDVLSTASRENFSLADYRAARVRHSGKGYQGNK